MKYRNTIIVLGFVVILIRLLGFSDSSRGGLYILTGILIIAFAYFGGKDDRKVQAASTTAESSAPNPLP